MTSETQILKNQMEIMWTLSYLLKSAKPDLVGKGGELDMMRQDLAAACKDTKRLLDTALASVEGK